MILEQQPASPGARARRAPGPSRTLIGQIRLGVGDPRSRTSYRQTVEESSPTVSNKVSMPTAKSRKKPLQAQGCG
eukprot:1195548-Prorocentrum_minimum.AAC.3